MTLAKKRCRYCGLEYEDYDDAKSILIYGCTRCEKCLCIHKINDYVSEYSREHKDSVWKNKIHERNLIKDNYDLGPGVSSYILADNTITYRVEKRTKRVNDVIDKISFIRDYLYFNLEPAFEILDSICIEKDVFWEDTGNFLKYVHNYCFQEAVIKLNEILTETTCKYNVYKIMNALMADSKYVFKEQKIFEIIEFKESKDVMEERYQPFNINRLIKLINEALVENRHILEAIKDYRNKCFAHIDFLNNKESPKNISYSNIKRMFSLAKAIYDAFLFVVAPDKYTTIIVNSNIWFSHMNEMSRIYKKYIEEIKKK